jgi:hypothetical protein
MGMVATAVDASGPLSHQAMPKPEGQKVLAAFLQKSRLF